MWPFASCRSAKTVTRSALVGVLSPLLILTVGPGSVPTSASVWRGDPSVPDGAPGQLEHRQQRKPSNPGKGAAARKKRRPTPKSTRSARKGNTSPRTAGSKTSSRRSDRGAGGSGGKSVSMRVAITEDDMGLPAVERKYRFTIDGTYQDLVENFARMAGVGLVGEAPVGDVSFISAEEMDFRAALNRVNLLLFKYKPIDPYWLLYQEKENHFEVLRVTDIWRYLPEANFFMNLAEFQKANPDDNELAMLIYTPANTSVSDFTTLREFMPDYVRIAPYAGKNSIQIFALVKDINKYLTLIKMFERAGEDPRVLAKVPVEHLTPTHAVETLRRLMDELVVTTAPRSRRSSSRGGDKSEALPVSHTIMFPDDAQKVIVMRAVPKQIAEVKEMLAFIDIDFGPDSEPVIIPIVHGSVDEIMSLIRPLLDGASAPRPRPVPKRGAKAAKTADTVATNDIILVEDSRNNTLVALGTPEAVESVQRLVRLFDVEIEADKPVFVACKNITPEEMAAALQPIMDVVLADGGKGKPKRGQQRFVVIPEPKTNSVILGGEKDAIEIAKELIEQLDVADEGSELHSYKLLNAELTTVTDILTMVVDQTKADLPAPKGKSSRKARSAGRGNVYGDAASRTLYVLCSDQEWTEDYLPLIKHLDTDASEAALHTRIEVTHRPADEVYEVLKTLLGGGRAPKPGSPAKYAVADDAIIVTDSTPAEIEQMRALIADIDRDVAGQERRYFDIQYASPEELKGIIESGVVSGASRPRGRPKQTASASAGGVFVAAIGRTLVVTAPADEMADIASLIERLDAADSNETAIRVYDVPTGYDVDTIAGQLESLIAETPRPRAQKRTNTTGGLDEIRVIAQPASRKILVSAPPNRFTEIEEALSLLLEGNLPDRVVVKFFPIHFADAETISALIEPILTARLREAQALGEIPMTPGPGKRAAQASGAVTVSPDVHGERIIVTAPATIVAEAESLIAALDREPADDTEQRVMRTIRLAKTTPEDMVVTIMSMMSGQSRSMPKPRSPRVVPRKTGRATKVVAGGTDEVSIVAAPGGGAVVLMGYVDDVDEVERWIRDLDSTAESEKTLKIYHVTGDVDQLAESIMALCDDGKAPARPKSSKMMDDSLFKSTDVRIGNDITLTTDYWRKIIVVRATPAKIIEVDNVVEMYEGKDGGPAEFASTVPDPLLIYELKNADAYDAAVSLEGLIPIFWQRTAGEPPEVEYIPGTNKIVVRCLPEYNSFIEDLIATYVDKEPTDSTRTANAIVYRTIEGEVPSKVAAMLKIKMPGLNVRLERIGLDIPASMVQVGPYHPPSKCVLPLSLIRAIDAVGRTAIGQTGEAGETDDRENRAREMMSDFVDDGTSPGGAIVEETESPAPNTVTVRFDDRAGVLVIEGAPRDVDQAKDLLDEIMDEIESMGTKPDIRVYRIKYRDVNAAANILETMFNARQTPQQQRMSQQLRMQQMRAQANAQRLAQRRGGDAQAPPAPAIDPRTGLPVKADEDGDKKSGTGQIRVFPDPQTRTLIIRADTDDFPIIVELLATIDRPQEKIKQYKIIKLERLVAADVEDQLKTLLGLNQRSAARTTRRATSRNRNRAGARRGGARNQQIRQMENELIDFALGDATGLQAGDVMITSNPAANTLLVKAPEEALEKIEELVKQLDAQDIAIPETRTYSLKYADAATMATQLKDTFGARGRGGNGRDGGFDPNAVNDVTFTAEPRTNKLIVRALDRDFSKIEPLINELDHEADGGEAVMAFTLLHANVTQLARTMAEIYGGGKGRRSQTARVAKFVGDESSNTLFVVAPENLREEIAKRVREIDEQAGGLNAPKVIKLLVGTPSEIARTLQETFAARGGRKGSTIRITGDDNSKQLFVTAPDDVFAQIQSLARSMDRPSVQADLRIFRLKYAIASDVHEQINKMVQQLARQVSNRKELGIFSSVVDDRSNSIAVMGGPMAFELVEQVLAEIDLPPIEGKERVTLVYDVIHADSTSLVSAINSMFRKSGRSQRPEDVVEASNDRVSGKVVVTASTENHEKVVKLLADFDVALSDAFVERVINLTYADAPGLARNLQTMFRSAGRGRSGRPQTLITADAGANALIVYARAEDFERIGSLVTQLDVQSAASRDRVMRSFTLANANPWDISDTIRQLYRPGRGATSSRDEVVIVPGGTSTSVIVATSGERMEEIATLIADFDQPSALDAGMHVIEVRNGDAGAIAQSLQKVFQEGGRGKARGQATVQIANPRGSNMILVKANETKFKEITQLVADLDTSSGELDDVEIIALKHTDAEQMRETLETLLRKPGQGGRGGQLIGDMRITANAQNNTLVISGDSAEVARIEEMLAKLDVEIEDGGNTPKIIKLEHARASQIEPTLTKMYIEGSRGSRGGRRGQSGSAMTPIIVADDTSNTLIVRASASDFGQIQRLIETLDTEATGDQTTFTIVTVAEGLPVVDLADTVQTTINEGERIRAERFPGMDAGTLIATPDVRSGTVILAGSPSLFADAEKLIRSLERMGVSGGTTTRIIRPTNRSPEEISRLLQLVIDQNTQRKGGGRSAGRRTPSRRQPSSRRSSGGGRRTNRKRP